MPWDRRAFFASSSAANALWPARATAQAGDTFRPEDFGARGDGATNDTAASAALSTQVNRAGGGTILLGRGRTYVIGRQSRTGPYGWSPDPIIDLQRLTRTLRIVGNGARLLCQPGLTSAPSIRFRARWCACRPSGTSGISLPSLTGP